MHKTNINSLIGNSLLDACELFVEGTSWPQCVDYILTSEDRGGLSAASVRGLSQPASLGPATPDVGPATPDVGPATRDVGPATRDVGPATRDVGPATRDVGPATRDVGPATPDVGPPTRDVGPATRDVGPATRDVGPATPDVGPATRDVGPATRDVGPATRDVGPATPDVGPATPDVGPANPDVGPATPDVGPAIRDVGPATPDVGPATPGVGPATPDVLALDVAGPSTSRADLATPNISRKRQRIQSSAKKRIGLFREEAIGSDKDTDQETDSDSEVTYRINPRESALMVTDKKLKQYLDKHCICQYCSKGKVCHTIRILQHDVTVKGTCNRCHFTDDEALSGNNENLISLVYTNMLNGHGYTYYRGMCSIANMKCVSYKTYNRVQKMIKNAAIEKWVHLQENTRHIIFNHYREQFDRHSVGGILDIDVSFDGSWHTRGHHSQIGCAFVVEIFTGLVVDYNCFCKKCKMLLNRKQQGKVTQTEFDNKMREHVPDCDRNYNGTAKNMEADAAVLMWGRSEELKFRYTTLVSDGDSSAFNKICAMNNVDGPYRNVTVEKAECINHFSKRLATQLRSFQKTVVELKETKGNVKKDQTNVTGGRKR
ncbi:uncharacterized protein [Procambarus clarkii]|uniref:uncharacterized protein n=1 Tax=Procambarus clarkii TaxID=6728 RepID=UPI00374252E4